MPDIRFHCSNCGQTLDAPEELATQSIACPTCKETILVPLRGRPIERPKPPERPPNAGTIPAPVPGPQPPGLELPPMEGSGVAAFLTCMAVFELVAAPLAGLGVGSVNTVAGWVVFLGGVVSGLSLLGFARVIESTSQSAQRLRRIEMLIQKGHDDKKAG